MIYPLHLPSILNRKNIFASPHFKNWKNFNQQSYTEEFHSVLNPTVQQKKCTHMRRVSRQRLYRQQKRWGRHVFRYNRWSLIPCPYKKVFIWTLSPPQSSSQLVWLLLYNWKQMMNWRLKMMNQSVTYPILNQIIIKVNICRLLKIVLWCGVVGWDEKIFLTLKILKSSISRQWMKNFEFCK